MLLLLLLPETEEKPKPLRAPETALLSRSLRPGLVSSAAATSPGFAAVDGVAALAAAVGVAAAAAAAVAAAAMSKPEGPRREGDAPLGAPS